MLKGKSSYQIEALSQASESSHAMIISRPGRDVVASTPTRRAASGYDPIEQRAARSDVLVPPCPTSSSNRGRHDLSGPLMAGQVQSKECFDKIASHSFGRASCVEG
jgi:hypothetical protein